MKPIYRGDNKTYTLSFKDSAGNVIDITGWKVYFTMKQRITQSDDEAAVRIDVTTHDDPTNGLSSIHLANSQTDGLIPGEYFYDIQVKKSDEMVTTLVVGKIKVEADVTRRENWWVILI